MAPGANCPLVVRFCPKALGQHQASLSVQVLSEATNRIIAEVPFQALGLCRQLGSPRRPLPGGPMALPESFVKPRQFVDPEKASSRPQSHLQQSWCMRLHACWTDNTPGYAVNSSRAHSLPAHLQLSLVKPDLQALTLQKQCQQHLLLRLLRSASHHTVMWSTSLRACRTHTSLPCCLWQCNLCMRLVSIP